jgi:hypothetical protein
MLRSTRASSRNMTTAVSGAEHAAAPLCLVGRGHYAAAVPPAARQLAAHPAGDGRAATAAHVQRRVVILRPRVVAHYNDVSRAGSYGAIAAGACPHER